MNRKRSLVALVALGSLAAVAGCGGGGGGGSSPPPAGGGGPPAARTSTVSFQKDVLPIFRASCAVATCHVTGGAAPMSLEDNDAYQDLVGVAATRNPGTRVAPGNSAGSVLFDLVNRDIMPVTGTKLSAAQKAVIKGWIDQGAFQDLNLRLTGFGPHVNQLVELRITDRQNHKLEARAIVSPLPSANFTLFLPAAVPPGEHDLDFFADLNGSGAYDAPPADHAWRLPIPSTGDVTFAHAATFTDIGATASGGEALPFTLNLTAMTPHVGNLFELRVIKIATGETVGAYRLDKIPASGAFTVTLPGIVDGGVDYQVDFFADLNGNGAYDAPPTDHAWRLTGTAATTGLTLDFAHNTTFTDINLTAAVAARAVSQGVITGFGSVFVNGVEFKTTEATDVKVDGQKAAPTDLGIGMVVNVTGSVDAAGKTGNAAAISLANEVTGPITSIDPVAGTLQTMGTTVALDDMTVVANATATNLAVGNVVTVSGMRKADGTVVARRVDRKATSVAQLPAGENVVGIKGKVTELDSVAKTCKVNGVPVNLADAAVVGTLADGAVVSVQSTAAPVAGEVAASTVTVADTVGQAAAGAAAEIEGVVTDAPPTGTLAVDGQAIDAAAATVEPAGTALDKNVRVRVTGTVDANGVLVASSVSVKLARDVKIEGPVTEAANGQLKVMGVPVAADAMTLLRDKTASGNGALDVASLASGDWVSVRGTTNADGSVTAAKLEKQTAGTVVWLQGPADAGSSLSSILGVPISLPAGFAGFQNVDGTTASATTFDAALHTGTVKVKGTFDAATGTITAQQLHLEVKSQFEHQMESQSEHSSELEIEQETESHGGGGGGETQSGGGGGN